MRKAGQFFTYLPLDIGINEAQDLNGPGLYYAPEAFNLFPQIAFNLDGCGTCLGIRRLIYGFGKEIRCLRWKNMLGNLLGKTE